MIVTITGIRDLSPESYADVELAIADLVDATEIRFGGALGADTVALAAAASLFEDVNLRVFVPATVAQQPAAARHVIENHADEVVELGITGRPAWMFLRRNDRMLAGMGPDDLVVAFTDGRSTGGTAYTIRKARELAIPVREFIVGGMGAKRNPVAELPAPVAAVHAISPYVSLHAHQADRASATVRALKAGTAKLADIMWLARIVRQYIGTHDDLASKRYLVPMPRRAVGVQSDLLPLADFIADVDPMLTVLPDWLIRYRQTERDGFVHAGRQKYPPTEHERTLVVDGDIALAPHVIILDNVVTRGGTMIGAQRAVLRDAGIAPIGLAVLYSGIAHVGAPP